MNKPDADRITSARSPFAGCAILIAAVAVMVFLIGFSILTLFRQFNEIAKFTGEKPVSVEITPLENNAPPLKDLSVRVEKFRQELARNADTTLALSADDINLAVAAYEPFKDLRGTFRVTGIEDNLLRIAISFRLNGKPRLSREGEKSWITSDARYLNGTIIAHPNLLKREVVLSIEKIEVPGAAVPSEFIDQMSPYRITERYLTDSIIGPAMAKLTRIEVSGGKILLVRKPGENPADLITDAQVDSGSSRLFKVLGIAAASFLAFAGLIVFLGGRLKLRNGQSS